MHSHSAKRVGDLVVVLYVVNEVVRMQVQRWRPPALLLPLVTLALIQKAPLHLRNEFLGAAAIIGVVRFIPPRQRNDCRMVKVIVPKGVHSVPPVFFGSR